MDDMAPTDIVINDKDLEWKFSRGTGKGGQHRNKTDTCVDLLHRPTGIRVRIDGRSQHSNKQNALTILKSRIKEHQNNSFYTNRDHVRKAQVGSGMRGDKVRTIRVRDDVVVDHETGKQTTYKKYSRGDLSELR